MERARQRAPYLIVAPERLQAATSQTVETLLHEERQWVRCGALSAFVPVWRVQWNWQKLPPGNPFLALAPKVLLGLLQASLSEGQWKRLNTNEGLGLGDLDTEQAAIFLALLNPPLTLTRYPDELKDEVEHTVLTEQQCRAVRLSLQRRFALEQVGQNPRSRGGLDLEEHSDTPEPWRLEPDLLNRASEPPRKLFGVTVWEEVPNRLKPGALEWGRPELQTRVALEAAGTIGELVRRVAQQSKLPLHCDPRLAALHVEAVGGTVTGSELLKALCWAVCGAFRQVGARFILTDDLVPLATRLGVLQDWLAPLVARRRLLEEKATEGVEVNQERYIDFADGDPLAPAPALRERIAALQRLRRKSPYEYIEELDSEGQLFRHEEPRRLLLSRTELPPPVRERLAAALAEQQERAAEAKAEGFEPPLFRDDLFRYVPKLELWFVVPTRGRVKAGALSPLEDAPPHPPRPAAPERLSLSSVKKERVVLLDSLSPHSLEPLATLARSRGFTALWVGVRPGDRGGAEAAIAVGERVGLPVYLLVHPLEAPPDSLGTRECNVLGETPLEAERHQRLRKATLQRVSPQSDFSSLPELCIDWLRPDDRRNQAEAIERFKELARVPGSAGIVVGELVPPPHDPTLIYRFDTPDWGYSVALREVALQRGLPDPVDISRRSLPLTLPWFQKNKQPFQWDWDAEALTLWQDWARVREESLTPFRKQLWQAIRATMGTRPLLRFDREYYGSFDKDPPEHPYIQSWVRHARQYSRTTLMALQELEGRLDDIIQQNWDGFVYDLRGRNAAESKQLLERLAPTAPAPIKPSR